MEEGQCAECHAKTSLSYMLSFSITSQLQTLFLREEFTPNLSYRFNRGKIGEHSVEDIDDGDHYKEQQAYGFLNDPWAISFMWNSDGAQLYKSSQKSIWPLYLVVNELPYAMRYRQENVIMAGLWCAL
uniref:Uncharacterized protein n=1 Tax=Bracon brevicornis TaxID=1563983 RepID=A0A6V7JN82_9HYME